MNCPNCGNNMDQPGQCPVCGTMVGGYNLAQDTPVQPQPDMQNQGFDPSFGGDMGVYQMDPSMTTAPAKKSPVGYRSLQRKPEKCKDTFRRRVIYGVPFPCTGTFR